MDNHFQEAALMLIDNHMDWLHKTDDADNARNMMSARQFLQEYRTLTISGRRRLGHSQLANRLAFDVGGEVGCKYSTIIIAPTFERAQYNYRPDNMYFNPEESIEQLQQCLADDYANEMATILRSHRSNYGGKVLSASSVCGMGTFNARQFCVRQRDAIFELTGKKVDKINLCIIDGWSELTREQQDRIYNMFESEVDLFVQMQ